MKRVFKFLLLLILLAVAALAGYFFLDTQTEEQALLNFVPEDFVYLIESDKPVKDWKGLSETEVWQYLKGSEFFADISESADYLDSLLDANETLVDFVELGDLMISAHMISSQDYDFAFLIDLKGKGRKLTKLDPVVQKVFENLGYEVTKKSYINNPIYSLYDKEYDETLSVSIVANVLIASYTENLVKKAIQQSGNPSINENQNFFKVREKADRGELYNIYLNYKTFNRLIGAYTTEIPEIMQDFPEILTYSSMDLDLDDEAFELEGFTKQKDSVSSFLNVFKDVGQGAVKAYEILPARTAMFTSIGFDDFLELYKRYETFSLINDPEGFEDIKKNKERIENLLKIEFERDFFNWMTDEIATAIVPLDEAGNKYAYYAVLHFDDYDLVSGRLEHVTERIRKRTPVKFEEVNYRGYSIRYLELNRFFKLFFKKLFSKIENPHFTYLDDYVVFSNDTTSLQYLIESYLQQETLGQSDAFNSFWDHFSGKSNVFTYIQNEPLLGYMKSTLDTDARKGLDKNSPFLLSFPQIGLQLYPQSDMYRTVIFGEFLEVLP